MLNLNSAREAARELLHGNKTPNVKHAFWTASLSSMQWLDKNGALSRLLAPYVHQPLPPQEELFGYLRQARGLVFGSHLKSLYYAEYLEKIGALKGLEHIGQGYIEQCDWRVRVHKLMKGNGLSWKTISFAALILDPMNCQLVPVDRHVLARLGYTSKSSPQQLEKYLLIEKEIMDERDSAGCSDVPLAIWHWYKWEEQRARVGISQGEFETHKPLSCRDY